MRLAAITRLDRSAKRLREIVTVLGKYGLADWLQGLDYDWLQSRLISAEGHRLREMTPEARIRAALTELGTTFIKSPSLLRRACRDGGRRMCVTFASPSAAV
jgi:ubiquinone biosynthesis protein